MQIATGMFILAMAGETPHPKGSAAEAVVGCDRVSRDLKFAA